MKVGEDGGSRRGISPKAATAPAGAHEWLSFEDPGENRTWVFDVTFLLSRWTCLYGRGCQGVLTGPAPELEQGCCSYGAHFTDEEDVARVEAAAASLSGDVWQHRRRALDRGGGMRVVRRGRAGGSQPMTRMVAGACIFLNRPGFAGGTGCALHLAALQRDQPPLDLKPEVCWQLPLRREDQEDQDGHVTSTVSQWDRRHWGPGGQQFGWWCTEAPEAFGGEEAVYRAMAGELAALVGDETYQTMAGYLDARQASPSVPLPHPAVRVSPSRPRLSQPSRAGR